MLPNEEKSVKKRSLMRLSAETGAAFLMATSAIGPGFLTQTSRFTEELLTSFGFVILISLLLDIGAQLNIWRVISITNKRAQDLANGLLPGLGVFLALLIALGGFVFNIGNIGGTGLGLNALTGMDIYLSACISTFFALGIFWVKNTGKLMDHLVRILGILMILFTLYIAFSSAPPLANALLHTFWPEKTDSLKIVTLVGGTVGGYISFAGAHRLIDAGITGKENIRAVTRSAVSGILITSFMRYILFLAVLGVVMKGLALDASNPAASVFRHAAGEPGYRFFGFVMWSAAITSVVGASFTTISFFRTLHPLLEKHYKILITLFILCSLGVFLLKGNPVALLIFAGAVNGLILPVALAVILIASRTKKIRNLYKTPLWLEVAGWLVVFTMSWLGALSIKNNLAQLF
ncbi:MAG: divalent metal cation transporter [Flavisolibacter sp.]|nr:divalent metal cation transporter [Flavisolibacter sp.]